jgi:hypothetical protein
MDARVKRNITNLIGENLDRVITIDWRGQGLIHPLYEALRRNGGGPLAMGAAEKLIARVREKDVVVILTGFPVGPFDVLRDGKFVQEHAFRDEMLAPETDGVVAAALIARAVDLGFGARPVILCEEECLPAARASCAAAGLRVFDDHATSLLMPHTVTVIPFTKDSSLAAGEARRLMDSLRPRAAVSIERPGRNEEGHYHMANGRSITDFVAKLDELFEAVGDEGGLTIGIGDLGNELGMGALKEATREFIFYGERCQCGCGAGIGTAYPAEATVFGAVSEDAAYAFLASLAFLTGRPELLQSSAMQARVLEACCSNGAVDGPTGMSVPWIDFLDLQNHLHQIELMREIIQTPQRFFQLQPFFYGERK